MKKAMVYLLALACSVASAFEAKFEGEKVVFECPQIWSEFFYSAGRESNVGPFTFDVPTQRARGQAYGRYVSSATSLGFVVGVEWFTLIDQAATGRYFQGIGGESYNTGLLSVTDRPYRDLWEEMAKANLSLLETLGR